MYYKCMYSVAVFPSSVLSMLSTRRQSKNNQNYISTGCSSTTLAKLLEENMIAVHVVDDEQIVSGTVGGKEECVVAVFCQARTAELNCLFRDFFSQTLAENLRTVALPSFFHIG